MVVIWLLVEAGDGRLWWSLHGGVVVDSDSGCGGCEAKILSVGDWPPTRGAVSPLSLHIEHRWNK